MKLTKKELLFISHACNMPEGIFDFENHTVKSFEHTYGIANDEVDDIVKELKVKVNKELKK